MVDSPRISLFRHQQQVIELPYKKPDITYFFLIAGYGSGKTSADVFLLITLIQRYFNDPIKIGVMGITITFLRKTLIGELIRFLIIMGVPYMFDKQENIVRVGAVELVLIAIEQPDDIYGHNFSISIIDELDELPLEKALAVFKAVKERTRVKLPDGRGSFSVFTTTAQGYRGMYKIVENLKVANQPYVLIRASTRDNTSLDKKWVDELYAIYDTNERLAYLDGYFVNLNTGRVYGDYVPDTCYVPDISVKDNDEVMIGQDFNSGFSKGVAKIKRDGVIYAVKNFSFKQIGNAPQIIRNAFPTQSIYWYPDASAKDIMAGYSAEIQNAGIQLRVGSVNPSIVERIFFVNKLFKLGKSKVCYSCKDLDMGLRVRQFDDNGKPEKGQGEAAPDHICDANEYHDYRAVSSDPELRSLWELSRTAWLGTNVVPMRYYA